jgi:hypothetical protein
MTMVAEKLHKHIITTTSKPIESQTNTQKFHKTTFSNEHTAMLSGDLFMAQ